MEIRFARPYVSGLNWRLHEIAEGTPVQDPSGNVNVAVDRKQPGLLIQVTPYIGAIAAGTEQYEFKGMPAVGDHLPSMDAVLSSAGGRIAQTWADALDGMANLFPVLADPPAGAESGGLTRYLRLDAWRANTQSIGPKAVEAVLGVYRDADYKQVVNYIQLVFADGDTMRGRQSQREGFQQQIAQANSILADPPSYPNWSSLPTEEQQRLIQQAPLAKKHAEEQIARLDSQLVAPLSTLFGLPAIAASVVQLVTACYAALVANHPDWANVDVATVMQEFAFPDVS